MPTQLLESLRKSIVAQSRDSFDSVGRSLSLYFARSPSKRGNLLEDDSNSIKPRWLSHRKSTFASVGSLDDLEVSASSIGEDDDDADDPDDQDDDDATTDQQEEEAESAAQLNAVTSFVNDRIKTFVWNIETIAGNIADMWEGEGEGEQQEEHAEGATEEEDHTSVTTTDTTSLGNPQENSVHASS